MAGTYVQVCNFILAARLYIRSKVECRAYLYAPTRTDVSHMLVVMEHDVNIHNNMDIILLRCN